MEGLFRSLHLTYGKMIDHYAAQGMIAGERLCFDFHFAETIEYYDPWLSYTKSAENGLRVPESDFEDRLQRWAMPKDAFTEFDLSMYRAGDALISRGKCILHGAAFLWRGKAFIFSAPSGTGKTTQLKHWLSLWGDETAVMNGDKPILQLESSGQINVLPSPWRGKERWGSDTLSAPLGGVIILEQGKTNHIAPAGGPELPPFLLRSVLASFEEKETIHGACRILDRLLRTVQAWKLTNAGDEASARLTRETLIKDGAVDAL